MKKFAATEFHKVLENTSVQVTQQKLKTLVLLKIAFSMRLYNILLYNLNQLPQKPINATELRILFVSVSAN